MGGAGVGVIVSVAVGGAAGVFVEVGALVDPTEIGTLPQAVSTIIKRNPKNV